MHPVKRVGLITCDRRDRCGRDKRSCFLERREGGFGRHRESNTRLAED